MLACKISSRITRRGIQLVLGGLWLLDGALQLQHQMFTSSFANNVIAPAAQGQPVFVSGVMHFSIHMFLMHPAIYNALIAIIQLSLGVLILWKRTAKYGLIASVFWGLFVWYVGEGLGGLASWQTLLLMGAPGAALIYVVLALGVMPPSKRRHDQRPAYWLVLFWALLWSVGAIYQLLPGQNSVSDIGSMISGNASGAPGWLASLDTHAAHAISRLSTQTVSSMAGMHMTPSQMAQMQTHQVSGFWFIALLAVVQLLISIAVLIPGCARRVAIAAGIVLSLIFWAVGQSFGGYYTGLATDPNSGPLFILLGVAVLGCAEINVKQLWRRLAGDFEQLMI